MRKITKALAVLLVLCMVFSLAACKTTKSGEDFGVTACIASEPETIDPSLNSSVDGATYIMHAFEGLYRYVPEGDGIDVTYDFGAAKSVDVSEDGLTYTFTLRDGMKWSDGEPVKAADFVYGWQRLVDPATASPYCYMIDVVENSVAIQNGEADVSTLGIKALDEKTIEIKLIAPCSYMDSICAFASCMPLREDVIEANGDAWATDAGTYIGNGAYKISEWVHDSYITMVKNENYWDYKNLTGPETITWRLMDDDNAKYAAFRSGELDFCDTFPVDETQALLADGTLQIAPQIGTYAVVFNTEVAPLDNVDVRHALALVIDQNFIVENVTGTAEVPATAWVPYGFSNGKGGDFRETVGDFLDPSTYEANCEEARALLAKAGYPDGKGFPVMTYSFNTSDRHQTIAEAIVNMWETELGITVNVTNQDWGVFLQTREDGDFEVARHGWVADFTDAMNFLDMWQTNQIGGNNYSRFSSAEYDKLIQDSITAPDEETRIGMLMDAEKIIMEDWILAPVYFYSDPYMLSDNVTNLRHTSLGYFFFVWATPAAK